MSKYEVGQRLSVICESIDENGKAKFRVVNEDLDEGIGTAINSVKNSLEDRQLFNNVTKMFDKIKQQGIQINAGIHYSPELRTADEANRLWKLHRIKSLTYNNLNIEHYLDSDETVKDSIVLGVGLNPHYDEAGPGVYVCTPIFGYTNKGRIFFAPYTIKYDKTTDKPVITGLIHGIQLLSFQQFKQTYNIDFQKYLQDHIKLFACTQDCQLKSCR